MGQTRAAELIGIHDLVGAGLENPLLGALAGGPGRDDEIGVQRPRGQHRVEVVGVVGQTADEPAGMLGVATTVARGSAAGWGVTK
jgi:hypothetical protein